MAGRNRALLSEDRRIIYENCVASKEEIEKCVFISHKSSDIEAAQQVAEYLMENDIDIYLDKLDTGLQKATKENDAQGIVDSINRALMCSTDILVLVSNQTQASWWVPYEVGYAKKGDKKIASALLLGNIGGFPDYLKIERMIKGPSDFKNYVLELKGRGKRYGSLLESANDPVKLSKYIRSVI